jgi:hypothetical protein
MYRERKLPSGLIVAVEDTNVNYWTVLVWTARDVCIRAVQARSEIAAMRLWREFIEEFS